MTTEELCAEIEELDKLLAEKSYPRLIEELRTLAVEAAKKLREMQRREAILTNAIGNREFMRGIYNAMDAAESGEVGKTLAQIKSELDADGELLVNKYAQDKIRAVKREGKE